MKIKENIPLSNYTTFKIGGPAKYFVEVKTKEDLIEAIKFARQKNLPFFILGGGSNLLMADEGYNGLVINFQFSIFNFQENKIVAGAGAKLKDLVRVSAEQGLTGIEWAAGIPGTIGGAVHNNAAAFEGSISDVVKTVEVLDVSELRIKNYELRDCKFDYKESVFKKNKNLIILSCVLGLKKGNKKEIQDKIKYFLEYRVKNHPMEFPSAGCIFKNPRRKAYGFLRGRQKSKIKNKKLLKEFPELEKFNKKGEVPAAFLIEECGLKGKRIGKVEVSTKHANFIVNLGEGKAKDVLRLINLIKNKVKNKFGIELKEEIQFLGGLPRRENLKNNI